MPKLTFEIETLNENANSEVRDFITNDTPLIAGVVSVNEVFELPEKKQTKEMYYKGLWNKFYAEIDLLNDNEFGDISYLISQQINTATKLRMENKKKNDAKLKGVIIN